MALASFGSASRSRACVSKSGLTPSNPSLAKKSAGNRSSKPCWSANWAQFGESGHPRRQRAKTAHWLQAHSLREEPQRCRAPLATALQITEQMSSPLRFRVLGRDDLPFADSLRALAGWNQTLGDWERFLVTEPTGCFLAEWNGTPAGTATTMVYGPELAWIGM